MREAIEIGEEEEEEKENGGGGKGKRKAGAKTAKKMVKKRRLDEEVTGDGDGSGMVTSTQKDASQGRKISIGASGDVSVIDTQ